jgi:hypothetical protein
MAESDDIVARLRALSDEELTEVVRVATEGRPRLAALHAAAEANLRPDDTIVTLPHPDVTEPQPDLTVPHSDVPVLPHPDVPTSPEVGPPTMLSPTETTDYTAGGVPTFGHVRDAIEERVGRAIGSEELDRSSAAGRTAAEQWEAREKAAHERLEEIRRSLHRDRDAGGSE